MNGGSSPQDTVGLAVSQVTPLPAEVVVGGGTALFVDGRCTVPGAQIASLEVVFAGLARPVDGWGMPLPERTTGEGYWWAVIPVPPVAERTLAWIELRAELVGGGRARGRLGTVELIPSATTEGPWDEPPEVAICMATYEPDIDLFRRQVDSIREQTHEDWVCLISDDASSEAAVAAMRAVIGDDRRFRLTTNEERLGFYFNFERALGLAPANARYVALADQDDRWRPDKLAQLIGALGPESALVYSDMRIVTESGEVLSPTYWQFRRNNHTDFASLVIANTVTGAASLFRRSLLDDALPFPPRQGNSYHDHWLAQVALALGPIDYVDEPLYDYVQHGAAAIGHLRANNFGIGSETGRERVAAWARKLRPRRFHLGWRIYYFDLLCRVSMAARTLELRLGARLTDDRRKTLARLDPSSPAVGWLMGRSLRATAGSNETLGREAAMLRGVAWRRGSEVRKRYRLRRTRHSPVAALQAAAEPGPQGSGPWLKPLLVDYFSRDGSTVLMRLLATSSQIAVEPVYPYERKYFAYLWRWAQILDRDDWPEDIWGAQSLGSLDDLRDSALAGPPPWLPRPFLDESGEGRPFARAAFDRVWSEFSLRATEAVRREHGTDAPVVYSAEKHMNTWRVPLEQLPPLQLLVVLRDPRDTFVSIESFGDRAGSGFGGPDAASGNGLLEHVITRQRERLRWIAGLGDEVPVVRYEDLVRDLDGVAERLSGLLGVELDPDAVRADRETRDRHRSAASPEASIGRWRDELSPEVAATFERELGDELRAAGFAS